MRVNIRRYLFYPHAQTWSFFYMKKSKLLRSSPDTKKTENTTGPRGFPCEDKLWNKVSSVWKVRRSPTPSPKANANSCQSAHRNRSTALKGERDGLRSAGVREAILQRKLMSYRRRNRGRRREGIGRTPGLPPRTIFTAPTRSVSSPFRAGARRNCCEDVFFVLVPTSGPSLEERSCRMRQLGRVVSSP